MGTASGSNDGARPPHSRAGGIRSRFARADSHGIVRRRGSASAPSMITRVDLLTALLIAALVSAIAIAASTRQGIVRDEAYYIKAGQLYVTYYEDAVTG